jgi:fumarate reductase subunit D
LLARSAVLLVALGLRAVTRWWPHERARNHPAYWAFLVHRISGIALALFLPAHFLALGTRDPRRGGAGRIPALDRAAACHRGRMGARRPSGGAPGGRAALLALEFLPWRAWQKSLAAAAAFFAIVARARIRVRALSGILRS